MKDRPSKAAIVMTTNSNDNKIVMTKNINNLYSAPIYWRLYAN